MDHIRFANSGTEATLFAMRAARCFTGKEVIVKMNGGYHGTHDYTWINVLNPDTEKREIPEILLEYGTPASAKAGTLVVHFNDLDGVEKLCRENRDRIAAIILAPILATNTIIAPEESYLQGLRDVCNRYGVLLIFDEVITFRLSEGGLQNMAGVTPDLTTLGKIIGGGFPIGAFGGKADIMAQFDPQHPRNVLHSGTFNGNNMAMVAGLAAMSIYRQEDIDRIDTLGDRLREGLEKGIEHCGLKSKVMNIGSLVSFLWKDRAIKDARDAMRAIDSTKELNTFIHLELLNRGIFIAPREFYSISTAMNSEDIDHSIQIFEETLEYLKPMVAETNPEILEM
jgi:glutamate-1-semialdehyde 2,1-aminomutase